MTRNRTLALVLGLFAALAVGLGLLFAPRGSGAVDHGETDDDATAQLVTAIVRDTTERPIRGAEVRLHGPAGGRPDVSRTNAAGEAQFTVNAAVGSYVVTATPPSGYVAHDDKDGGVSQSVDRTCTNVYLCIYLTGTEVRHRDGTSTVELTLTHVRPEQRHDLHDLWFELTMPAEEEAAEREPAAALDPSDEADAEVALGSADPLPETPAPAPGLSTFCVNVQHQPVAEQGSASGIWVRGEVYGFDGGWVWVEGPSINGGEPVALPVDGGAFEGPLGINSYGDHPVTGFELRSDIDTPGADLLPALADGPGAVFPVGADEGPILGDECFSGLAAEPTAADEPTADEPTTEERAADEPTTDEPATEERAAEEPAIEEPVVDEAAASAEVVESFLAGFVAAHVEGDVTHLLDTLHPAVPLAFGDEVCSEYVAATTGAINGFELRSVGQPVELVLDSPAGAITFPETVPFTVEFTITDGSTLVNDAHLGFHAGEPHWLTRCGVE